MNCLKCGAPTEESQVFCNHCLELMASRPVKQGTPLHFPLRETQSTPKPTRRRRKSLDTEEKLSRLRKALLASAALSLVLLLTLCITLSVLHKTQGELESALNAGKNYMVETIPTE